MRSSPSPRDPAGDTAPFVSVVIPARNEARAIDACLEALANQTYPAARMEVIVVDGKSEDATRAHVLAARTWFPSGHLRLLSNPDRIIPKALNLGIAAARGSIIVRMDAHSAAEPSYVEACVEALRRTGASVVGGSIRPVAASGFARAVAIAQTHPFGSGGARFHHGGSEADVDTVYLGAYLRSTIERIGGYDASLERNEDYELNTRIRASGGRVRLVPAIASTYRPRASRAALARQYFAYGWWKVETLKRHPRSFRLRQVAPPVFFASVGVSLLASFNAPSAAWIALGLILTYVAGHAVAFVDLFRRGTRSGGDTRAMSIALEACRVLQAITIMHGTWSAGFLLNVATGGRLPRRAQPANVEDLVAVRKRLQHDCLEHVDHST